MKNWVAIVKVKVMVRAHNYNENMTISTIYSELLKLLKVNLL